LLKTINDSNHDWYVRIPHALWAYRTSIQTPIGVTPFSFVYGAKAVLPLEIEISSLQITLQDYITNEATHQTRLDQLILLDERRVNDLEHLCTYQGCIK